MKQGNLLGKYHHVLYNLVSEQQLTMPNNLKSGKLLSLGKVSWNCSIKFVQIVNRDGQALVESTYMSARGTVSICWITTTLISYVSHSGDLGNGYHVSNLL